LEKFTSDRRVAGAAQHRALPGRRFRPLARRVLRGV